MVFSNASFDDHESVLHCYDAATGLRAIIALHNTVRGPGLGGTRMWDYQNEEEALTDVLRLSRGMTFKNAIANLPLGGGKAVIIGDARKEKTPELLQSFGRFVERLSGSYITAEDVNMSEQDMAHIRKATSYVTGIAEKDGGNGDPSPVTAFTTYLGMKAAVKKVFGSDSLTGKRVLVQGVGSVGSYLLEFLKKEGASLLVSDIFQDKLDQATKRFGAQIVAPEDVMSADVDVYAPCALGATITTTSINRMKCGVICGAANNQLEDEELHGSMCREKGIVYAPDFLVNCGGVMNVCAEYIGRSKTEAMKDAQSVYDTTLEVLNRSDREDKSTQEIAKEIAMERIMAAKKLNEPA